MSRKRSRAASWLASHSRPQGLTNAGLARAISHNVRTVTAKNTAVEISLMRRDLDKLDRQIKNVTVRRDQTQGIERAHAVQRLSKLRDLRRGKIATLQQAAKDFANGKVWRCRKAGGVIHNRTS